MNSTGLGQVPTWLILKLPWNVLSRGMELLGGLQRDGRGMFLHPEGSRGMGGDVPAPRGIQGDGRGCSCLQRDGRGCSCIQRDPGGWEGIFLLRTAPFPIPTSGMALEIQDLIRPTSVGPRSPGLGACSQNPFMLFPMEGSRIPKSLAQPHPTLSFSSVDFSPPGTAQHLCR